MSCDSKTSIPSQLLYTFFIRMKNVSQKFSPIILYCFTFFCLKIALDVPVGRTAIVSRGPERQIQIVI